METKDKSSQSQAEVDFQDSLQPNRKLRVYRISTLGNPLMSGALTEYRDDKLPNAIVDLKMICQILGAAGMAANQIGYALRVCAVKMNDGNFEIMVNPRIIEISEEFEDESEGCYSLPGYSCVVERAQSITVEYIGEFGDYKKVFLDGKEARYAQHEIDHLEGTLISDYKDLGGESKLKHIRRQFKDRSHTYGVNELGVIVP